VDLSLHTLLEKITQLLVFKFMSQTSKSKAQLTLSLWSKNAVKKCSFMFLDANVEKLRSDHWITVVANNPMELTPFLVNGTCISASLNCLACSFYNEFITVLILFDIILVSSAVHCLYFMLDVAICYFKVGFVVVIFVAQGEIAEC